MVRLVHPSAVIGTDVEINDGTAVTEGIVINISGKIVRAALSTRVAAWIMTMSLKIM